jgi:hypothetical protein
VDVVAAKATAPLIREAVTDSAAVTAVRFGIESTS